MPIIINEFEIIPTPTPDQQQQRPTQEEQPRTEAPPSPDPREIIRVQRLYMERQRRLRAD
jgi:hypothetical protein